MESPPYVGVTVIAILYIARHNYPDESFGGIEKVIVSLISRGDLSWPTQRSISTTMRCFTSFLLLGKYYQNVPQLHSASSRRSRMGYVKKFRGFLLFPPSRVHVFESSHWLSKQVAKPKRSANSVSYRAVWLLLNLTSLKRDPCNRNFLVMIDDFLLTGYCVMNNYSLDRTESHLHSTRKSYY